MRSESANLKVFSGMSKPAFSFENEMTYDFVNYFDDLEFIELKESLKEITVSFANNLFAKKALFESRLSKEISAILYNDIEWWYDNLLFLGHGWHYYKLLETLSELTLEINQMQHELKDDFFNQELPIKNLTLEWPESAIYLSYRLDSLNELHRALSKEILLRTDFNRIYDPCLPGLSLVTNSHVNWIKNLDQLHNIKDQREKFELLWNSRKYLTEILSKEKTTSRIAELVEGMEFHIVTPGVVSILPKWYSITENGIVKADSQSPNLNGLLQWIDDRMEKSIEKLFVPKKQLLSIKDTKEIFRERWEKLNDNGLTEVSPLINFIESNFAFDLLATAHKLPYTFKVLKEDNLKGVILEVVKIFDDFCMFNRNQKKDVILWLYMHFKDLLEYDTIKYYVYHHK